jgi:hypothetical protein
MPHKYRCKASGFSRGVVYRIHIRRVTAIEKERSLVSHTDGAVNEGGGDPIPPSDLKPRQPL